MKALKITFPEGYEAPDKPLAEFEEGETLEALVTISKKKGDWIITAIEGIPLSEAKEEAKEEASEMANDSMGAIVERTLRPGY